MEINLECGTRLLIQMKSGELYEGSFSDGDKDRITVYNVSKYPDAANENNASMYKFYKTEIESITALEMEEEGKLNLVIATVPFFYERFEKIKDAARNYVYIPVTDDTFHAAINHIKSSAVIGVVALGICSGRLNIPTLISVATKTQVYIFDNLIANRRIIDMGLRDVFESDDTVKVLHNANIFTDCFHHIYEVNPQNLFDVQIADQMLRLENQILPSKLRSLNQVIHMHLGLPFHVIQEFDPVNFPRRRLVERPVSHEIMLNLSLQAMYLLTLQSILDRKMLHGFYTAVDLCLDMRFLNDEEKKLLQHNGVPIFLEELL